ncbi:MAG: ATP-binding protein [Candidatus Nanoarchaeia archaeon]|nr:ATP-binding protein [Candidatus Nanoarchaeia archaeon]
MISRKKQESPRRHEFWSHFHHMVDISKFGNEKIVERLDFYSSVDDFFEKNFLLANIPEKYFKFDLETIRNKVETIESNIDQIKKIEKYINSVDKAAQEGIGLYISGSHGVGKTAIAIIILKIAIEHYYSAFFSRSAEIIEFVRAGWKNEDKKAYFTYVVNNCKFFVIDDIGRLFSQINDAERANIDEIFTKRDDSDLCTIITANHPLETNKDLLGEALYSNFKERLIEVKLLGEDYRNIIGESLLDRL